MKSWHKIAALALLAVGLAVAGAISARRAAQSTPDAILNRVSDRLMCRCGCNQHLNACNHHPCGSADPMRAQIRASISAGKDEETIIRDFVEQMGAAILAAPPAEGFTLTAYVAPFAVVLLGCFVIYRVVKGWTARPAGAAAGASPPPSGTPPADPRRRELLDRYGAAIEEELEREA